MFSTLALEEDGRRQGAWRARWKVTGLVTRVFAAGEVVRTRGTAGVHSGAAHLWRDGVTIAWQVSFGSAAVAR